MTETLENCIARLMSIEEAAAWIAMRLDEFALAYPPSADSLRDAARRGTLHAILKGEGKRLWLTREDEVRAWLHQSYQPRATPPKTSPTLPVSPNT